MMDMERRAAFIAEQEKEGDGNVVFYTDVPQSDRQNQNNHDVADAYGVVRFGGHPAAVIIWGLYRGEWQANVSPRWLVSHLLFGYVPF